MVIGYDGKRAIHNLTGLGNYSRLVIESYGHQYPSDRLLVYTPSLRTSPRLTIINGMRNVEMHLPEGHPEGLQGIRAALWRSWDITAQMKRNGADIFHGLSNELPLNIARSGVPSVVTIHDVIYRRLPYCYHAADRLLYDFKYGHSCRAATHIIAVSERTKLDIMDCYGISEDKITVVYQGCDESFKTKVSAIEQEEVRARYKLPAHYLLQVGTVERRKNLELSIRALSGLPDEIHLVAVGRGGQYLEQMKRLASELGVSGRVHFRSGIPFIDLPAINQRAEVILYPSHYEGFGIPVLEGLESQRPVVAATGSCLEEAGGDAAWYVDPGDARGLQTLLSGILDGSVATQGRIIRGKEYARRFDNKLMASRLAEVYRRVKESRE